MIMAHSWDMDDVADMVTLGSDADLLLGPDLDGPDLPTPYDKATSLSSLKRAERKHQADMRRRSKAQRNLEPTPTGPSRRFHVTLVVSFWAVVCAVVLGAAGVCAAPKRRRKRLPDGVVAGAVGWALVGAVVALAAVETGFVWVAATVGLSVVVVVFGLAREARRRL